MILSALIHNYYRHFIIKMSGLNSELTKTQENRVPLHQSSLQM